MVFGDTATGKSTFSRKLGQKLSLPVFHLDELMDRTGREDWALIGNLIRKEADKEDWIIEGNAFNKDKEYRIREADLIIVFSANRFISLFRLCSRYMKIVLGIEKRVGSSDKKLNLKYYAPYVLWKFPKRKKRAIDLARSFKKEVILFKSRKEAESYLAKIDPANFH